MGTAPSAQFKPTLCEGSVWAMAGTREWRLPERISVLDAGPESFDGLSGERPAVAIDDGAGYKQGDSVIARLFEQLHDAVQCSLPWLSKKGETLEARPYLAV